MGQALNFWDDRALAALARRGAFRGLAALRAAFALAETDPPEEGLPLTTMALAGMLGGDAHAFWSAREELSRIGESSRVETAREFHADFEGHFDPLLAKIFMRFAREKALRTPREIKNGSIVHLSQQQPEGRREIAQLAGEWEAALLRAELEASSREKPLRRL